MGYAWEKLFGAVLGMTRSTSSLQVRLADAYVYHLIHIRPEENLPEDLRPQLAEIAAAMQTQTAKGDEGDAMASALILDEMAARNLIEKVVSLYNDVTARQGDD